MHVLTDYFILLPIINVCDSHRQPILTGFQYNRYADNVRADLSKFLIDALQQQLIPGRPLSDANDIIQSYIGFRDKITEKQTP